MATFDRGRRRAILAALEPGGIRLRLKGTRGTFLLPYGNAFLRAVAISLATDRIQKINAKRAGRKS